MGLETTANMNFSPGITIETESIALNRDNMKIPRDNMDQSIDQTLFTYMVNIT